MSFTTLIGLMFLCALICLVIGILTKKWLAFFLSSFCFIASFAAVLFLWLSLDHM
ncbi:hypothetical protein LOK74_11625 [Brevibacillus humidisoli]|uniref:hypothetical protein n=1 Tax=Brevibacillus humidisoli TaxID=2895522 RepID=UPI001E4C1731|nr:hypothetical protein [Brevibacillus humidisoli]UFJ43089.1 hypothetical protein LOK74_11625 [Brevibacillus humidisoli]